MGQPTIVNLPEEEAPPPPPYLGIFDLFAFILEWAMTIVAIIACGMLFSAFVIPTVPLNKTAPETPPTLAPPLRTMEQPSAGQEEKQPSYTEYERSPSRKIDLPPLVDTYDWLESSPQREQPFLRELEALNFTRPVRSNSANFRLSGDDLPTLYDVHLSVKIRGHHGADISETEGRCRTHFKRVGAASTTVELHAFGLYIVTAALSCDGRNLSVVSHNRNNRRQSLIITANEEIQRGSSCVLELVWTGLATTDDAGLYETWYTREDGSISVALTTHGETMHTRKWMPCFDEPRYKTPFKLSIEHSSDLTALSNARILSIEDAGAEGRSITSFEETWPISTYLHAFSVTDYVSKSTIVDGLPVSVFVPPTLSSLLPRLVKDVEELVPLSLKSFNAQHLNRKMDFIFFPDHSSAMENPGHISLGTGFLYSNATLVHEMMHQYFGNLLTLEWWSDLWINEGLANYYEDAAMARGDSMILLSSLRRLRDGSMDGDVYDTSFPLHNPVDTFIDSRLMFRKPYTKGAMVLNMLRDYVGKEEFDGVIEKLLNTRANSTLSLQQFLDSLIAIGGEKGENAVDIVKDFFGQAGYPLLVVRHVNGMTVIRQVRFHRGFVDAKQRDFVTRWTIPVHLTSLDGTYSRVVVMEREASSITLPHPSLLIVDPSRVVNYRVIYERQIYEEMHSSSRLSDADKDLIENDLVEAAAYGYADAIATYDTIMRRSSKLVFQNAYDHLKSLFPKNDANKEEVAVLLEKLSGHKLNRRHRAAIGFEHPLRQRRHEAVSDFDDEDDSEGREGWLKLKDSTYCAKIRNKTDAEREYNKLDSNGRREIKAFECLFSRVTKHADFKRWIYRLFDNHDHTFHMGDRHSIINAIGKRTRDTNATFLQDVIVGELPDKINYYEITLHHGLQLFGFATWNKEQLKRLITHEKTAKAAAENWVDIANLFERAQASKSEAEILGPKVVEGLKKLAQG